jgi:hypothetical protein
MKQSYRDAIRRALEDNGATRLTGAELTILLDDADRCAELEKHLQTWIDAMERDEPGTLRCGRTMAAMFKDFRDGTGAKQYGELLKKKDSP